MGKAEVVITAEQRAIVLMYKMLDDITKSLDKRDGVAEKRFGSAGGGTNLGRSIVPFPQIFLRQMKQLIYW